MEIWIFFFHKPLEEQEKPHAKEEMTEDGVAMK